MVLNNQDITSLIVTNVNNQVLCIISDENMFGSGQIKIFIENKQNEIQLVKTADGAVVVIEPNSLVTTKDLLEPSSQNISVAQGDFVTIDNSEHTIDLEEEMRQESETVTVTEDKEEIQEESEPISVEDDISTSEELLKQIPQEVLQKFLAEFLERTKQQKENKTTE